MMAKWATAWLSLLVMLCATRCATAEKKAPKKKAFTLHQGAEMPHVDPLPDGSEIVIRWHHIDGKQVSYPGFRGWDFNEDGTFEMLEVLHQTGRAHAYAYDFDADGMIDKIVRLDEDR